MAVPVVVPGVTVDAWSTTGDGDTVGAVVMAGALAISTLALVELTEPAALLAVSR